jgi:uncharacterized protein (DUF1684 family)
VTDKNGKESRLTGYRTRRDQFFAQHAHSPLTPEQKSAFSGLNYFPEREELAMELALDDSGPGAGEEVLLDTTDGKQKTFHRAGRITFEHDGEPITLTVLRDGVRGSLFIPFRDANAGEETYNVGRYLEPRLRPDGTIEVDFNYAYNPFCAYGDGWSCPIPPVENHLATSIQAGERKFEIG